MEDNKENAKQVVKLGAQVWLKAVTAPITAAISSALLSILPYILMVVVLVILFIGIYFAANEQADEYYDTAHNIGERMGNLISLHGFRTIKEVEQDEQAKFLKMTKLYKDILSFNNYDISLLTQTLLFEGSNEERIYLSESNKDGKVDECEIDDPLCSAWTFVKNIATNYQRGFLTSYAGQSQYLKANKNMLINAIALRKCKNLVKDNSPGNSISSSAKVEQCYEGYLVAEYNYYKDWLIDAGYSSIDTGVEKGYLVLRPTFNSIGHYLGLQQDLSRFRTLVIDKFEFFTGAPKVLSAFSKFYNDLHEAINIVLCGELADEDTKHFYYDGYITQNLKEEYKVYKNEAFDDYGSYISYGDSNNYDEELYSNPDLNLMDIIGSFFDASVINEETKNRKETAELIIDEVYYYYELAYGKTHQKDSNKLPTPGDDVVIGNSCSPISSDDLKYFSSPTSNCSVNSCFGVYAGGWGCEAHKGIDVNAGSGIYSVCDGKVTKSGMYNDGSASAVEVECEINGKTYKIRYLHMPMSDVNNWQEGDLVPKGTYLGQQGDVGKGVTGAHLHLDISLNGEYINPEVLVGNCSFSHDCDGMRSYCESVGQYYCKN